MFKNGNLCDNCNIELISRTDDTKESYEKRFDIYMTETAPVIDYYRKQGKLITIDGTKEPEETLKSLITLLGVNNG